MWQDLKITWNITDAFDVVIALFYHGQVIKRGISVPCQRMMRSKSSGTDFFFNVMLSERIKHLANVMLAFVDIKDYQNVVKDVIVKHFIKPSEDREVAFEQLRTLAFSEVDPAPAEGGAPDQWRARANVVFSMVFRLASTNLESIGCAEFVWNCLESNKKEKMIQWMNANKSKWDGIARTFVTTTDIFYQQNKRLWKAICDTMGYVAPAPAAASLPDRPPAYTKEKFKDIGGHLYGYSDDGSAWIIIHAFVRVWRWCR